VKERGEERGKRREETGEGDRGEGGMLL